MVTVLPKASPIVLTGESCMSAWMTKASSWQRRLREITDGLLDNYGNSGAWVPSRLFRGTFVHLCISTELRNQRRIEFFAEHRYNLKTVS